MLIFVEYIRKLTIKFICLFQFRFSNTVTIFPLKGWDTLSVFLLTIYVSIEVSGISLNVTNQVIDIQIMLLFYIGLDFPSQSFKFCPKFTTASLFRFCMCFISSTNLPSYLRGYPSVLFCAQIYKSLQSVAQQISRRLWICFRLTPPYMLFLMLYVPVNKYLNDGPFWPNEGTEYKECEDTWWTNLLYINNIVKSNRQVYSVEFQFPIVLSF